METNIAELLNTNRQQQSIIYKKMKEKRDLKIIVLIQGFLLLVLLLMCTVNLFLNFGLLLTIANLGIIGIAIKKFVFIDEIKNTLIEAKEILCANFEEELRNLKIDEVLLQEMEEAQKSCTKNVKPNERIEQLKRAREFLQTFDTGCLETDSIAEIEKAKMKIKRKGRL